MGYKGNGPIDLWREVVLQPILKNPNYQRDTTRLGYNSNQRNKSKEKQKVTLGFLSKSEIIKLTVMRMKMSLMSLLWLKIKK